MRGRCDGRALLRSDKMAIVDMTISALVRSTPLPDIENAAIERVVKATTGAAARPAGQWPPRKMNGCPDQGKCRGAEKNGKLVLVVDFFIAQVGMTGGHTPTCPRLNKRLMLQGTRGVFPAENEIRELTVV